MMEIWHLWLAEAKTYYLGQFGPGAIQEWQGNHHFFYPWAGAGTAHKTLKWAFCYKQA